MRQTDSIEKVPNAPRVEEPHATEAPSKPQPSPSPQTLTQTEHQAKKHEDFFPISHLDQKPLPKSGPTIEALDNIPTTGLLIRIRVFIDEFGVIKRVEPLMASPDDEMAIQALESIFMNTTFLPGMRQGQSVRSYLDIEITPNVIH